MIKGFAAHSSKPELGASAVHAGALLAAELDHMAEDAKQRRDASGRFDPPYDTVHIGSFHGGIARTTSATTARSSGKSGRCPAPIPRPGRPASAIWSRCWRGCAGPHRARRSRRR
ncbi:peptidase dimerization domain-containing protein [Bosea thiooxidans]